MNPRRPEGGGGFRTIRRFVTSIKCQDLAEMETAKQLSPLSDPFWKSQFIHGSRGIFLQRGVKREHCPTQSLDGDIRRTRLFEKFRKNWPRQSEYISYC